MDDSQKKQIEKISSATPLQLPKAILETELHDQRSAIEAFEELSESFSREDLMDNVVNPTILTVVDSLLSVMGTRKLGLSAQRVMVECKEFNYDGKVSYLMPDSFVESRNAADFKMDFTREGVKYVRKDYEDTSAMGRYKAARIRDNGGRVNMEDEYRLTRDITGTRAGKDNRRNDPKFEHVAETDHIVPLHTVFEQAQDIRISDRDIKTIANQDSNFAVTGRLLNNPKRDMSNSEFIAQQDRLKAEGKPYVELTQEQRDNMLRMEAEAQAAINRNIQETIENNLKGEGLTDRVVRQAAIQKKEAELGRKLNDAEREEVFKKLSREKALNIYKEAAKSNLVNAGRKAAGQSLMYMLGDITLMLIKPLYYEIKDGFVNGFAGGVLAGSYGEALKIRFTRIKDYVWSQLKDLKMLGGEVLSLVKNFISSMLENLMTMFLGIFKKIARILKEGVKIVMQTATVLAGPGSKERTAQEKADAVVKIVGASAVSLIGIGIDAWLSGFPQLPEQFRGIISTFASGIAGMLVFWALDKADLFNVKADRRNKRIMEVFALRISETEEMSDAMVVAVTGSMSDSSETIHRVMGDLVDADSNDDLVRYNDALDRLYTTLFGREMPVNIDELDWNC